ncbi:MAG: cupin domain-containing protein [Deltaproteobacteria bacterium]|nr:MAG: cupin domain-containing protein [Deltaproteobacteria bacterium]
MKPEVKRQGRVQEFETSERCSILEVANDTGDEQVSIARAKVKPGTTTAWHKLNGITERYIIIAGKGRVQIGDSQPLDVHEGDVVRIPADTAQRIENMGEEDLVFYAVCSPRFRQKSYVSLES